MNNAFANKSPQLQAILQRIAQGGAADVPVANQTAPQQSGTVAGSQAFRDVFGAPRLPAPEKPPEPSVLEQVFPRATDWSGSAAADAKDAFNRGNYAEAAGHGVRAPVVAASGVIADATYPAFNLFGDAYNGAAAAMGGMLGYRTPTPQASTAAVPRAAPQAQTAPPQFQMTVESLRPHFIAQESSGNYGAVNSETGALGAYQVMPTTGKTLAGRLGMPWKPALMRGTSPEARAYQDKIGGAAIQEAIGASGGDPATAFMYYHGGSNRKIWGPRTQKYAQDMLGRIGGGSGGVGAQGMIQPQFMNPFDPTYHNKALGALNSAEAAALNPFSSSVEMEPMPEMPDRPETPTKDWTDQDAALEALRPEVITEKSKQEISRRNWISGIAQGLMGLQDGAGLGKVLATLGGSALAGRANGDAEIQARMDAFDDKMARFNAMQFQYSGQKADQVYAEAVQEASSMYAHNMNKFQLALQNYQRDNNISVSGTNIVVQSKKGDTATTKVIPIAPAIKATFGVQRASVFSSMGAAQNQGNSMVAGATNQFIAAEAMAQNQAAAGGTNGQPNDPSGLFQSGYMVSQEVLASGAGPTVLGPEVYSALMEDAKTAVLEEGLDPGSKEYSARVQQHASFMLYAAALNDPTKMEALQNAAPSLAEAYIVQRARNATTTQRTNRTGVTTTYKE